MNLTYIRDIPSSPNNPSNDQPIMKVNDNSIDSILTIDHFGFNDNQGGYHNVIHQPSQNPNVNPATIATIGQLYVRTIGLDQQLFYKSGNGIVTQLTGPTQSAATPNGLVYLNGGILLQWGVVNAPGSSGTVLFNNPPFNVDFPVILFNVQLSLRRTSGNQSVTINSAATFDKTQFSYLVSSAGSVALYWVAIGA